MTDSLLCTAPYDCASPRPLLLVSSKVQLHILRVVRHRLTEKTTTTKKNTHTQQDKLYHSILSPTQSRRHTVDTDRGGKEILIGFHDCEC